MTRTTPKVIVFDVNETLSDLSPMGDRLEQVGVPAELFPTWFAGTLRDGFAITVAGGYADFTDVAREGLRRLLATRNGVTPPAEDLDHVMAGFATLNVHSDVPDGVRALREAGLRLLTMTNGTAELTEGLLERARLREHVELLLDVRGPRCWKPAPAAYRYAVDAAGVAPSETMLVAVHPWDVDGAIRAGLRGAWVRRGTPLTAYPQVMTTPTLAVDDLVELASRVGAATAPDGG